MDSTMARMQWRARLSTGLALATLAALTLLAWLYLLRQASPAHDPAMPGMPAMHAMPVADAPTLVMSALMWMVMMVAMMLPTASPMILAFTRVHRQRHRQGGVALPTWLFVAGYLVVWSAFSVLAAAGQGALQAAGLLDAMGAGVPLFGAALLVVAGVFQWTALKEACLAKCRTPLSFLLTEWREGPAGAFVMGVRHGAFCLGCCWALMLLMFVGGAMSLLWMGALAIFMLVEKIVPPGHGQRFGRWSGAALALAGLVLAVGAWPA